MEVPIYYDYATQLHNAISPGSVHPKDNTTTRYYMDYLLKRAMSVLKFDNIPDNWDRYYFEYMLYCRGFVAIIDSPTFGVIPQMCQIGGWNIYRAPSFAMIANQVLPSSETGRYWLADEYNKQEHPDIKGTCVLIRLQPNFKGLLDVCSITAERLAYMHEALMMNLANSKLAYIIGAENKATAELFKAAVDSIQEGNLMVAAGKGLWYKATGKPLWQGFSQNLSQNYIATNILEDMRAELNDFNNFIGIPSTNYNKKAHMTEVEVNANDVETESLVDIMYESVKFGIDKMNAKYGLNVTVKKRYGKAKSDQEVQDDGEV